MLFGGDKAGVSVCTTGPGDWHWSSVLPAGPAPADRRWHSATRLDNQLTMFGGTSLADGSELADLFWLTKAPDGSWSWGWPRSHTPYIRCGWQQLAWGAGDGVGH